MLQEILKKYPIVGTIFEDDKVRMRFFLYFGAIMNGLYVVLKISGGIIYKSLWLSFMGGYYLALVILRLFIIHFERYYEENADISMEYRRYRDCGIVLLALDLLLVFIIILAARFKAVIIYPGIIIYGMALYFFYSIILAVYNLIRKRKTERPIYGAARIASFVSALVSALSLEFAMMARFGGDDIVKRRSMTIWTGSIIFTLILCMAMKMILRGRRYGKYS